MMAVANVAPPLLGRRALVTGAGGGIGTGIARQLRAAGATVVCADIRLEAAAKTAEVVDGIAAQVDVTDEGSVQDLAAYAHGALDGVVDLLVCNAGILTTDSVIDLPVEDWDRVMAVNVRGPFLCAKVFARAMIGGDGDRAIVNVASISGRRGSARLAHYCASKFAVIGLSQSVADELGPEGITVNCVCPGHVDTPMLRRVAEGLETPFQTFVDDQMIRRTQSPEDIGDAVVFLAASRNVTGQALNVDGGWHCG